jgi:hypothetical protein
MRADIQYKAKTKNRRIEITLFSEDGQEPFFTVETKRLLSFEKREIIETKTVFSVETFSLLTDLQSLFIKEPIVNKKINPYSKFPKWNVAQVTFKKDDK